MFCSLSYFFENFYTAGTSDANIDTYGYHVFVSWKSLEVDSGSVLAQSIIVCQIVCRSQGPSAITADKTEVTCMIVIIVGIDIEGHTAELLFHLGW